MLKPFLTGCKKIQQNMRKYHLWLKPTANTTKRPHQRWVVNNTKRPHQRWVIDTTSRLHQRWVTSWWFTSFHLQVKYSTYKLLRVFGLVSLPNIPLAFPLPSPLFIGTTKLWLWFFWGKLLLCMVLAQAWCDMCTCQRREKKVGDRKRSLLLFLL